MLKNKSCISFTIFLFLLNNLSCTSVKKDIVSINSAKNEKNKILFITTKKKEPLISSSSTPLKVSTSSSIKADSVSPLPKSSSLPLNFYNQEYKPVVVAHRGVIKNMYEQVLAPENTYESIRQAYLSGANVSEFDVQLTKDQEVVVMHDEFVNRTTNGTGQVGNMTLAEIRELSAGVKFGSKFAYEKIPTLDEMLNFAKDRISVIIDIKLGFFREERKVILEKKILELVFKYKMEKYVSIITYENKSVNRIKKIAPNIPIIISSSSFNENTPFISQADYVSIDYRYLTDKMIESFHKQNYKIFTYTVDKKEIIDDLKKKGIYGIMTTYPDLVISTINGNNN